MLTFNGTAGQLASVQVSNSTFSCDNAQVSIQSPDGATLGSTPACGTSFLLNPVTLPVTGNYTVVVAPLNGATGTASILLSLFQEQTGTITPGTALPLTLNTPGQAEMLTFNGTAGQLASVQVSNSTFSCDNAQISIQSPDGATLGSRPACGTSFLLNPVTLPVTGNYTVVVAPSNGATGTANLTLSLTTVPIITSGTATDVTITTTGQVAQFVFSGIQGQTADLR